jgi:hypothetical protein
LLNDPNKELESAIRVFEARFAALDVWPAGAPPKTGDRLVDKILTRCRVSEAGCWEWQGALSAKGYGRVKIDRRLYLPHRVTAFAFGLVDSVADDSDRKVCVLHECDNRRCCNPAHLKAGGMSENMKDCATRGRHKRASPNKNGKRASPYNSPLPLLPVDRRTA